MLSLTNGTAVAREIMPIVRANIAREAVVMTDDDKARFDERLRKIVKHKPAPEKPE